MLVARPLIDWSNARKVVDGHTRSEEHMDSITRADHFVRICRKEEQNVVEFGSTAYRQKVQKKTYLRSTMSEQRLSGLALMHIHRSHTIDIDKVLSDFDASGHRRIAIVFDNARRDASSDDE